MAQQYERAFIQHLCVPESLRTVVEMDLPDDIFPEEMLRPVYRFAIDYWHTVEGDIAPSPEAMRTHFSNQLAEHNIDLDIEPEDTLEWALDVIQGAYFDRFWQIWVRNTVIAMAEAELLDKVGTMEAAILDLMGIQSKFSRSSEHSDIRTGISRAYEQYIERENTVGDTSVRGAIFGIPEIDAHIGGVRPGEVAVLAAPPKTGKSFSLVWGAYRYWLTGGIPVLYTLENSVAMTLDRLACMVLEIDSRRWDEGQCTPEEKARVEEWLVWLGEQERPFHILQPEEGKRSAEQLVRQAKTLGDAMYLDQLTFVEVSAGMERRPRHEQVANMMRTIKNGSNSGQRLSTIIAHQINREGVEHARKQGYLLMDHLAEASEVERTADYVFGLWQDYGKRDIGQAWFQTLAARRRDNVHWLIDWEPFIGNIGHISQITLPELSTA